MSAGQALGAIMLTSAFIAVFAMMARSIGWKPAAAIIGGAVLISSFVATAIQLLVGAK